MGGVNRLLVEKRRKSRRRMQRIRKKMKMKPAQAMRKRNQMRSGAGKEAERAVRRGKPQAENQVVKSDERQMKVQVRKKMPMKVYLHPALEGAVAPKLELRLHHQNLQRRMPVENRCQR